MLVALQVDAKAITDMNPLIMRQLRWLCITCDNKKRCEHEFAKGTATEHFREFCPNTVAIDGLLDQKVNHPHIKHRDAYRIGMSALGHKRTFAAAKSHVRFTPESGHVRCN